MIASAPAALEELGRQLDSLERRLLKPPPRLTISEWADRERYLSAEASAEPGRWRTDRAPYLREIMDVCSDPHVRRVAWMSASQLGKTECVLCVLGYYIDQDPAPVLILQPNEKPMGMAFSKDRLAPMIRDTPALRDKVKPSRSRDSGNTLLHKSFAGGHLTIAGANSPAGLASRPIRVVLMDEVDRYPPSAGAEGDPVSLAEQRAATFWNRLIMLFSTPTIEGASRIESEWEQSDQRRFFVPCPHCDHFQALRWGERESGGVRWDSEPGEDGEVTHEPESAAYECEECHALIPESAKRRMLERGEWKVTNPRGAFPGFHLNALYSPWARWADLVRKFLAAARGGRELLQTFQNLQLGLPWKETAAELDPKLLAGRRETWEGDVPDGVGVLTAAVDVQGDRLELLVNGWGAGEQCWGTLHERIFGDPDGDEVWDRLEYFRTKAYRHANGAELYIRAMVIDSGYKKEAVYRFVKPRQKANVFASKGMDSRAQSPLKRAKKADAYGIRLLTIGVNTFKDTLFSRLALEHAGPRYKHFPPPQEHGFDAEYFDQFGAEVLKRETESGQIVRRWVKIRGRRNEAIDLEVMALAALHALGGGVRGRLGDLAREVSEKGDAFRQAAPGASRRKGRRVRSKGLSRP